MRKLWVRLLGVVVMISILGFGLWLFGDTAWGVSIAVRSVGWPSTPGVVLSSAVCPHYSKTGTTYSDCLTYRYTARGQVFEGSRITGAPEEPGSRQDAEATVETYAVGTPVTVFYDPAAPSSACLVPGVIPWVAYVKLGVGLLIALVGLWLIAGNLAAPLFRRAPAASPSA